MLAGRRVARSDLERTALKVLDTPLPFHYDEGQLALALSEC
jgi:hypothetical protein